jgi:hypothetical protein
MDSRPTNALHSPVRLLPPELLSHIFSFCLLPEPFTRPKHNNAPWVLCLVCSYWRSIAVSTPRLWSSLSTYGLPNTRLARELVKIWLSRTGGTPLSIHFTDASQHDELIELILSYSSLWRKVECNLTFASLIRLHGVSREGFPWLESFTLISSAANITASDESLDIFRNAPRLRSVQLLLDLDPRVLKLPFAQLTDFHTSYITSVAGWLKFFEEFRVLASCMCYIYEDSNISLSLRHTGLPLLRSLHISASQPLGALFDHLILPSLETLMIEDEGIDHAVWSQAQFMSFLSPAHSSSSLRCLRIINTTISSDDIIECLQQSRLLTELSLHDIPGNEQGAVTDRLLDLLTYRSIDSCGKAHCLCPMLQDVSFAGGQSFKDNSIVSFANSRWFPAPHLDGFTQQVSAAIASYSEQ